MWAGASAVQGSEYDQEHKTCAMPSRQPTPWVTEFMISSPTVYCGTAAALGRGLELSLESDMPVTSSNVNSSQHYIKASRYVRKFAPYVTLCLPILCLLTHQR